MRVEKTGTTDWEFAITGIPRREMVLIAAAVLDEALRRAKQQPSDAEKLLAIYDAVNNVLYPGDAIVSFEGGAA